MNIWTCDIDEDNAEERCTNIATRVVTWYDEADEELGRGAHTLKVCESCFAEVKHGVWETPAVVSVGTALIGPRSLHPSDPKPVPIRPTSCSACAMDNVQREAVAVIALDTTDGLMSASANPDQSEPVEVCAPCLAEFARIAGIDLYDPDTTTGRAIINALKAARIPAVWAWTGGNCRAIGIYEDGLERHVLITHEFDPFTDDDFEGDVSGNLAVSLYRDNGDDEPTTRVIDARSPADVVAAVAPLVADRVACR